MSNLIIIEGATSSGKTSLCKIIESKGYILANRVNYMDDPRFDHDMITESWWRIESHIASLYNLGVNIISDRSILSAIYWSSVFDNDKLLRDIIDRWLDELNKWDNVFIIFFDLEIADLVKNNNRRDVKDDLDTDIIIEKQGLKHLYEILCDKLVVSKIKTFTVTSDLNLSLEDVSAISMNFADK